MKELKDMVEMPSRCRVCTDCPCYDKWCNGYHDDTDCSYTLLSYFYHLHCDDEKHFLTVDKEDDDWHVRIEKYNVDNLVDMSDILGRAFRGLLERIKEENSTKHVNVDLLSLMLSYMFVDSIGQREAANVISLAYLLQEKYHIPKGDIYRELNDCLNKKFNVQEGE